MRNEETEARIVREAMEEIVLNGYSRVTMDQIARRLGMSKKTLYQYFASKRDLLRAILAMLEGEIESHLLDLVGRQLEFQEKFRQVGRYIAAQYARFGPGFVSDLRRFEPQVWEELEKWRADLTRRYFSALIHDGVRQGALRADVDPALVELVYLNAMGNLIHPAHATDLPMSFPQISEAILRIVFEGIFTDEARMQIASPGRVAPALPIPAFSPN